MTAAMSKAESPKAETGNAPTTLGLAFDRTRLAADRTLMAWVRTSLSMITFGFTIYKFFQYLRETGTLPNPPVLPHGPRRFGLALAALGTILLAIATTQYVAFIRRLSKESHVKMPISPALVAAWLISLLGLAVLIDFLFRLGPF